MTDGYLEIIFGPMFSGKTSTLLMILTRAADTDGTSKVLYINTSKDERQTENGSSEQGFSTHNSTLSQLSKKIQTARCDKLSNVDVSSYDIIGVDEGNFYEDIVRTVVEWVEKLGKHVYVVALDGDHLRRPFGKVLELAPYANRFHKITSRCCECVRELRFNGYTGPIQCADAPFTKRTVRDESTVLIGGSDMYSARCRRHYKR